MNPVLPSQPTHPLTHPTPKQNVLKTLENIFPDQADPLRTLGGGGLKWVGAEGNERFRSREMAGCSEMQRFIFVWHQVVIIILYIIKSFTDPKRPSLPPSGGGARVSKKYE